VDANDDSGTLRFNNEYQAKGAEGNFGGYFSWYSARFCHESNLCATIIAD